LGAGDPDPVAPLRVEAMAKAPQQSRRVLVIDDIDDIADLRFLLRAHLERRGFDVVAAIGLLRATLPNASIRAASATPADTDNEGLACAAGADGYFDKAAGFDDLVRQFASLFDEGE
jgi:hypothetical protein